jgi:uncharacterized protein YyaL (SSP411 family)
MLAALSTCHSGLTQIVIAGSQGASDTRALVDVVRRRYLPAAIVIPLDEAHAARVSAVLPWTAALRPSHGRATAYLCRNFTCELPTTEAAELERLLA